MKYQVIIYSETRDNFIPCSDTFIVIAKTPKQAERKATKLLHAGKKLSQRNYVKDYDTTPVKINMQDQVNWIVNQYNKFLEWCEKSGFDKDDDNHYQLWLKGISQELTTRIESYS